MSDVLSSAELHGHQVELLPARTVLSLFADSIGGGLLSGLGTGTSSGSGSSSSGGTTTSSSSGGGLLGGGGLMKMIGLLGGHGGNGPNGTANAGGDGATNG